MKKLHVAFTIVAGILFTTTIFSENTAQQKRENIYDFIAKQHLPTMAAEELKEIEARKEVAKNNSALALSLFSFGTSVTLPELGSVEKLRQAYLVFSTQKGNSSDASERLEESTLFDLEILSGPQLKKQRNITTMFEKHLHTAVGKVQLQKMMCEPSRDKEILTKRQTFVKRLLDNRPKLDQLNKKLELLRSTENEFLWFWKSFDNETDFDLLEDKAVSGPLCMFPKEIRNGIEKNSPLTTELSSRSGLALQVLTNPLIFMPLTIFGGIKLAQHFAAKKGVHQGALDQHFTNLMKMGFENVSEQWEPVWNQGNAGKAAIIAYGALLAFSFGQVTYMNIKRFADYNAANKVIMAKMNAVAQFARISHELLGDKAFNQDEAKLVSSLVQLFNSSTLKNNPSFFSYNGRGFSAFMLMLTELRNQFVSLLEEIGKLDAQVAVANFMVAQEHNKSGAYCFPTYIESDTPYLKLSGYWHPFLNPNNVVVNDLELGGAVSKNIIVTGPNAGGKSTSLKSITLAIVFAQSLGIAPAKEMTLAPFKIIHTYMNIADDPGSESLFQAEMHRAARLLDSVQKQGPKDFIFVVMDELFTGTNPLEGSSAAYGVIQKLIRYPQAMLAFATHYKNLTALEQETNGLIRNFKVWVKRTEQGGIVYPYTLIPGISDQTIALDLLALEKFDPEILDYSNYELKRQKAAQK